MKKRFMLIAVLALALGCREGVEEKARGAIKEGGKAVEETATKVVDEVSSQFEGSRGCKVELSEELKAKGIGTGKFYIEKDSITKKHNKLVIYIMNDKNYDGPLNIKVSDKDGVETGRTTLNVNSRNGQAGYQDVVFDKRTNIESKSTISIY